MEARIQGERGDLCLRKSRYIIGIDLGTTNSTLSYIDSNEIDKGIRGFDIPQLIEAGEIKALPSLPSCLYLPGDYELPEGSAALPWNKEMTDVAGEFARVQGTKVPSNLVTSAKSWLCYSRVDREGPILPWGKETSSKRVSPVEASAGYLMHMRDAWNFVIAGQDDERLFERQQVIIGIPASFDETARELTAEAARIAGIEEFTMIEEPQAAFYAWLSDHEKDWSELIGSEMSGSGRLILIFDVGGGTTDFTLIYASEKDGRPSFDRIAVGDHLMLGGDNMDLTLAKLAEKKLLGPSGRFDFTQWLSASHQCRMAKEKLLTDTEKGAVRITVLGRGKSIVGGLLKADLTREEVEETVLNGFFEKVSLGEEVQKTRTTGLQELGLPFVPDTAVMRHLSTFLKRHTADLELHRTCPVDREGVPAAVRPDILLFNGGVFKSRVIRERATNVLREWFSEGGWELQIIENRDYDRAVSIGAAYYGEVLRGSGERISGGAGRAYYIAVERPGEAADLGLKDPLTVVCILPRGIEAGEEIRLSAPEFQVMTNNPISFAVFSSSYRAGERPGDIITAERDEFAELPPVRTVLHYGKKAGSSRIPVSLGIKLNDYGTLDVWCESRKSPHKWRLAFQLRAEGGAQKAAASAYRAELHTIEESAIGEAIGIMDNFFSSTAESAGVTPENVIKKMSEAMGLGKDNWPLPAIRKIWDHLITLKDRRRLSPKFEARWLNLSGILLRPGFGYQVDTWRIDEIWKIFSEGPAFPNDAQCRLEWWITWRRLAGGLDEIKQDVLFRKISPHLLPSRKKAGLQKLSHAEVSEMWMLASSLEHLPSQIKTELGDELIRVKKRWQSRSSGHYYWALSRIGARIPFHGPIDRVAPKESVQRWIKFLLDTKWDKPKEIVYALAQMARKTGDRVRDIGDTLRESVAARLSEFDWAERSVLQVRDVIPLEWEDERSMFGESLPTGLYIES